MAVTHTEGGNCCVESFSTHKKPIHDAGASLSVLQKLSIGQVYDNRMLMLILDQLR